MGAMARDSRQDLRALVRRESTVRFYRTQNLSCNPRAGNIVRLARFILDRSADVVEKGGGVHHVARYTELARLPILQQHDPAHARHIENMLQVVPAEFTRRLGPLKRSEQPTIDGMAPDRIDPRRRPRWEPHG